MPLPWRRAAVAAAPEVRPPPPTQAPELPAATLPPDLVDRWLRLSELQRRGCAELAREIEASSTEVETSMTDLSQRFQRLATTARAQVARVDQVVTIARSIDVEGEPVPLDDATRYVQTVLGKVVDTVLQVSKNAMRMVYALDDVAKHVTEAEHCLTRIAEVTRQTRYLALNAAIEANRAQGSGGAFKVIAAEIGALSKASSEISDLVHQQIHAVAQGVRTGHRVLQEIATVDMTEHILAKAQLNRLMTGLMQQNRAFTGVLSETVDASQQMSSVIGELVSGIQFQDRNKQHLEYVVATLTAFAREAAALEAASRAAIPDAAPPGGLDEAALARVLAGVTLSAARQRFVAGLGGAGLERAAPAAAATTTADQPGDIELF